MTDQEVAGALALQQGGADIVAILLENVLAAFNREGRLFDRTDLLEGVGLLLSAAWQLAKLADDNADRGRSARYVAFVRSHTDAAEFSS